MKTLKQFITEVVRYKKGEMIWVNHKHKLRLGKVHIVMPLQEPTSPGVYQVEFGNKQGIGIKSKPAFQLRKIDKAELKKVKDLKLGTIKK